MSSSISSNMSGSDKFKIDQSATVERNDSKTIIKQQVESNGRKYTITITANGRLSDAQATTQLTKALEKTMALATTFKLGHKTKEQVSSLKLTSNGKAQLFDKDGKELDGNIVKEIVNARDAKIMKKVADLEQKKTEERQQPEFGKNVTKMYRKIDNLKTTKFLLGSETKPSDKPVSEPEVSVTATPPPPIPPRSSQKKKETETLKQDNIITPKASRSKDEVQQKLNHNREELKVLIADKNKINSEIRHCEDPKKHDELKKAQKDIEMKIENNKVKLKELLDELRKTPSSEEPPKAAPRSTESIAQEQSKKTAPQRPAPKPTKLSSTPPTNLAPLSPKQKENLYQFAQKIVLLKEDISNITGNLSNDQSRKLQTTFRALCDEIRNHSSKSEIGLKNLKLKLLENFFVEQKGNYRSGSRQQAILNRFESDKNELLKPTP